MDYKKFWFGEYWYSIKFVYGKFLFFEFYVEFIEAILCSKLDNFFDFNWVLFV